MASILILAELLTGYLPPADVLQKVVVTDSEGVSNVTAADRLISPKMT